MGVRHQHWIGGRPAEPADGGYLPTVDPSTRLPGDEIAAGSAADADRAVAAAAAAQPGWAERSGAERADVLHRAAGAIESGAGELMEVERACTGKTEAQLRMEVGMSADYFRYYAGILRAHHGRTIDLGAGNHTYTRLEPYGVVAAITPWNLPLNQACRALAPALAAGNALVAKPSEFTSVSTLCLARLAGEAGLPDGLLNVVTGTGPDAGAPLAAHPGVRRVTFTGSVATGRLLAGIAADRLVPMTLELGGKSPLVVFADADTDRAIAAAVSAVAFNAGQVCSATTRLLVEASAHDAVVAGVVEAVERLRPGIDFGPMITEAQFRKVLGHFADAKRQGAVPVTGGSAYDDGPGAGGRFIRPTVYAGVTPGLRIAREEVFGPVLVTMPFADEAEAVALANDTDYGLVAAVWSGDAARGLRVAERIDAGQVAVNGGALGVETPFGGFKASGYGREKGIEALHEYAQTKTISLSLRP
ncbi:aldehyde dehydrogenase family protein [Actinomadura montaniterrae]|uniref:Aldehyde dehydrogenase n=1 Tax=Actinomadura montaniterrae TaxID=1803903 RepID=A0A6L3VW45_9ACTN|nr:aldehyde dehydrogenase family protein [Actinomadura montaniterrae]KAB2379187.1 aldehyde dehydrogenase [Actinomadura montaniterrae]